jgi:hypothetical protein
MFLSFCLAFLSAPGFKVRKSTKNILFVQIKYGYQKPQNLMPFTNLLKKLANKCMRKSHLGQSDGNMELWAFITVCKSFWTIQ